LSHETIIPVQDLIVKWVPCGCESKSILFDKRPTASYLKS
jgi:hypothetical protein